MNEHIKCAMRELWRSAGGRFHGPHIETGTMPENTLLPFLAMLVGRAESAEAELAKLRERAEKAEAELRKLREQEPVAIISQNDAGQISIKNHDGTFFDMSKHVGCQFYAAPVAASAVPAPSVPEEFLVVVERICRMAGEYETAAQSRALLQSAEVRHD